MLTATFQCFSGIRDDGERRLWERNCLNWRDFRHGAAGFLSVRKQTGVSNQIKEAESALAAKSPDWFLNRLKNGAKLRVLDEFWDDALFLDIETTGLSARDQVTSIATWKRGTAKCFVEGVNLLDIVHELGDAKLLVTYNGARFDLPFLRRRFRLDIASPHLDLMVPFRSLGYRGGLKACEQRLSFKRRYSEGADGLEAVRLWHAWRNRNDEEALKKLMAYNLEDTFSMVWLATRLLPLTMPNYPISFKRSTPSAPDIANILASCVP